MIEHLGNFTELLPFCTPKTTPEPGCRGSYVPKTNADSDNISQDALTAEALSETDRAGDQSPFRRRPSPRTIHE